MPALDLTISGYSQALLLNFEKLLTKEFGDYFVLAQNNLALALQLSEYSSRHQEALRSIQADNFERVQEYINSYKEGVPDNILVSGDFCFRAFLLPILGNHAKSSDIAVEFIKYDPDNPEEMAQYEKNIAFIKQKRVQVADQGKLRPSDVVRKIRERIGIDFSIYLHTCAWRFYKVRPKEIKPEECKVEFCQYNVPFNSYIYTEKWVDFLCEKLQDEEELNKIRECRGQ